MSDTVVSVIMNCLNSSKYLQEAIDSVYAQTYKNWEIIFWDNASTDNSEEIAKKFNEKLKYFKSEQTVVLGKARNLALQRAGGKYIAFLDCDDIWSPQKLEKQLPLLENQPSVGIVYSNVICFNEKGISYLRYYSKNMPRGKVFSQLLKRYFLSISTVIIRKDAISDLEEWFDETLNVSEEADLFLRIAYNWELDYINEPLSKYRMHRESWTFKHQELFPTEQELILKKLCRLYPSIEKEYESELKTYKSIIHYYYALINWEKGNPAKARLYLKPYLKVNRKLFLPYLASYFVPYKYFNSLLILFKKARYAG